MNSLIGGILVTKQTVRRRVCAMAALLTVCAVLLAACGGAPNGKKAFTDALFAAYMADVEFLFEYDGTSVAGTARVTRDDNIRIDITAPDPFTGISVQSDAADRSSIVSISYSGIKADISKSVLEKINLVLTLFSDSVAGAVEKTPAASFLPCEEVYAIEGLSSTQAYKVEFTVGDIRYLCVYDRVTGTPLDLCAESGGSAVEVKIKKFKAAE